MNVKAKRVPILLTLYQLRYLRSLTGSRNTLAMEGTNDTLVQHEGFYDEVTRSGVPYAVQVVQGCDGAKLQVTYHD